MQPPPQPRVHLRSPELDVLGGRGPGGMGREGEPVFFFKLQEIRIQPGRAGNWEPLSLRIMTLEGQDSTPTACGKGSLNEGRGQRDLPGMESPRQLRGRGRQDSQRFMPGGQAELGPQGTVKFPGPAVPCLSPCTRAHTHFYGVRGQGPQRTRFTCIPACDPSHSRDTQTGEAFQARPPQLPQTLSPRGTPPSLCQPPLVTVPFRLSRDPRGSSVCRLGGRLGRWPAWPWPRPVEAVLGSVLQHLLSDTLTTQGLSNLPSTPGPRKSAPVFPSSFHTATCLIPSSGVRGWDQRGFIFAFRGASLCCLLQLPMQKERGRQEGRR